MTAPALGFDAQAIESHTSIENHRRLGQVASSVNSHFPLTLGGLPAKFWVDQYLWDDCVVFVHPDIAIWMVEQQADSEKRFHILRDPQPFLPSDLKSLRARRNMQQVERGCLPCTNCMVTVPQDKHLASGGAGARCFAFFCFRTFTLQVVVKFETRVETFWNIKPSNGA